MQQLRDDRMSSTLPSPAMHCAHCGSVVYEGPHGGYVCGQCFHTVEPPTQAEPPPVPGD
ncbi:hypothetical protein [Streptomyces gobiensis]|uniref:hypothetical protein n=1 Tax=Streptomyces gobiensis TaxID=2875706 RepID=UPI001E36C0D7|nr:hypothetical protein [Streptomyces gobiensis]UGY90313.1 hypothetical protein test1122_00275 [Streptomyces gobiensis]